MATWTQEDVDELKSVIKQATAGKVVKYGGPPAREVTSHDLPDLRALLADMIADVQESAGTRPSYVLIGTRKGTE